ncbi:MAG: GAF domain-containing SpoIIE family protein phosphatase, partial [Anaerolineales bacterium]
MDTAAGHLALLYRISQTLTSSLDLEEVLNRVMDEVIAATHAERGFLMLRRPDGSLNFQAARGLDQRRIEAPEFQVSRGIVDKVARSGQPMLTSDAQSDARLNLRQSVLDLGLRSILCVPLQLKSEITGVIYVDNQLQAGIFTPADLELLAAIAPTAAIAIENARLYQAALEQGRLERELQMARDVQARLMPRATPQRPGWDFAARWEPAREVAGDYYDFITDHPDGSLGFVIADVTDKGMPAALMMALTRSVVRASTLALATPAEAIAQANRLICADAANDMFVTLFYGRLDLATGRLTYVNAGQNPPLLFRAGQLRPVPLTRTGMALGLITGAPYEQRTLQLEPGDWLFLYTDGVTDAMNAAGQSYDEAGLIQCLSDHC